ncbi:hypothetical protein R1flu_026727 [Riccia fluitans]|uniref:F-box domain-containing protein n=1 Tax=Riccia fluitans TaxID=41844 RepID=A0ABD1XGQ5_9MARC
MAKKKKLYDKIRFRRRRPRKKSVLWGKPTCMSAGNNSVGMSFHRSRFWTRSMGGRSLPSDVFCTVLARLPVNSMMRFRTVCKAWNEMPKDPNFLDAWSRLPPRAPSLVLKREETCFRYEPDTDKWMSIPDSFFQPANEPKFQVVNSKGGRLLLKRHYRLVLFNPVNRSKRNLPPMLDLDHETHDTPIANEVHVVGMYVNDSSKAFHVLVLDKNTNYAPPDEDEVDSDEDGLENASLVDGTSHCLIKAINPHILYNQLSVYSVLEDVWVEDIIDMPEEDQELIAPHLFRYGSKQLLAAALIDREWAYVMGDFPRWKNLVVYELNMTRPPVHHWGRMLEIEPRVVQKLLWHMNVEDFVFRPECDFLYFGSRTGSTWGSSTSKLTVGACCPRSRNTPLKMVVSPKSITSFLLSQGLS